MKDARRPKVWHIYEFEHRFELAEDARVCRKGSLLYCREAVSNSDDAAKDYRLQLAALHRYGNHLELHGAFIALRNQHADRSRAYRGYLLNGRRQPAQIADVCDWLALKAPEARKILKRLEAVGLIERVELPEFDLSKNEKPGETGSPEKSGKVQSPLKREGNGNGKGKRKGKKNGNGKDNSKPKPKASETAGPMSSPAQTPNGGSECQGQPPGPDQVQGIAPSERETAASPTAAPPSMPTMPTKADARGPVGAVAPKAPWRSQIGDELDRIGRVLAGTEPPVDRRYSDRAQEFAALIYQALGLAYGRVMRARELGTFAACWTKAERAGLPPPVAAKLWDEALTQAGKLRKKRKLKKPGAMFCRIWDSLLAKAGARGS